MRNASDEDLMRAYGGGDVAAFEQLYQRYRGPLYRYFNRQVSEPATANDLYQGCWEKVIKARRSYRVRSPFRAWLFRIAHNHLVDHYRAGRPTMELPDDNPGPEGEQPPNRLDQAQRGQRFRTALEGLPPEQRDVLLLRLESGFSVEEIADITGVGAETAKSRLRYATRKLKQVLQS
jgi:RNA polymerase sigma factor (sigma-70 family)